MSTRTYIYLVLGAIAAALGWWWWSNRSGGSLGLTTPYGQTLGPTTPPPVSQSSGPGIGKGLAQAGGAAGAAAACASTPLGALASPACAYVGGALAGKTYDYAASGLNSVKNVVSGWF
jgi:hypothetical protein